MVVSDTSVEEGIGRERRIWGLLLDVGGPWGAAYAALASRVMAMVMVMAVDRVEEGIFESECVDRRWPRVGICMEEVDFFVWRL